MSKITLLSQDLINKIAAGEVVERPASVVKELVENAVDAKATHIKIEIENGGLTKISVTDRGVGMDLSDLTQSVVRHATSKIKTLEDLEKIATLGFRGEALASIGAVSKLTIRSKTENETVGNQLIELGGNDINISSAGMPTGTQVIVADLFYNVPARKKFSKTAATEFRHITDIVTSAALANPSIGFALIHNKRTIFDLPKQQKLNERIMDLLAHDIEKTLLPVTYDHPHLSISGFITKPHASLETSMQQFIIVNGRPIRDKLISSAIKQGYGTLLPPRSYPVFILEIRVPPEMVDVNVHPRKEEVKFVNSSQMFQTFKQLTEHSLSQTEIIPSHGNNHTYIESEKITNYSPDYRRTTSNYFSGEHNFRPSSLPLKSVEKFVAQTVFNIETDPKAITKTPILQINNLYLVTQNESGLIIIDQHAAHERILYEEFLKNYDEIHADIKKQPLLISETLELSHTEAQLFEEHLETLTKLGFEFETFGTHTYKITAVPLVLSGKSGADVIRELLADLIEERDLRKVDRGNLRVLTSLSCRMSVMAGERLSAQTTEYIYETLLKTPNNATCPHGRPTRVQFLKHELDKMFKRV